MNVTFPSSPRNNSGIVYKCSLGDSSFLVDCGLDLSRPGSEVSTTESILHSSNATPPSFVILTSGQTDCSGLLPILVKHGFSGPVYGTRETLNEALLTLKEIALMSKEYCSWLAEHGPRLGLQVSDPVFSPDDVQRVAALFTPVEEGTSFTPLKDITITINLLHNSHLNIVDVEFISDGKNSSLVFAPAPLKGESTRQITDSSDRKHSVLVVDCSKKEVNQKKAGEILAKTLQQNGKLLIAVSSAADYGRVFEFLSSAQKEGVLKKEIPVYFDSHLTKEVLESSAYDVHDDFKEQIICCPGKNDSMVINDLRKPAIIISSILPQSMGRMAHHLKHHLWEENNAVLLWGNVHSGTVAQKLLNNDQNLWLFGTRVLSNCSVHAPDEGPVRPGHGTHHDERFIAPEFFKAFSGVLVTFDTENDLFDYEEDLKRCNSHGYVPLQHDAIHIRPEVVSKLLTVYEEPLFFSSTVENDLAIEISNFKRSVEEAAEMLNGLTAELSQWADRRSDSLEAVSGCSRVIEIIIETLSSLGNEGIVDARHTVEDLAKRLEEMDDENNSEALAALSVVRSTLVDR